MEELEIFYQDKEAIEASKDKRLSVVISADSLCSFIHSSDQIYLVQRDRPLLSTHEFNKYLHDAASYYELKSVMIYSDNAQFSLIPKELSELHLIESQISSSFKVDKSDEIGVTALGELNVCFLRRRLHLRALSPNIQVANEDHFVSLLLRKSSMWDNNSYCYFLNRSFYFLQKSDGRLIIATRYEYNHQNDVLYHLQMAHNHVHPITSIVLGGFISEESKVVSLLNNYFTDVKVQHSDIADRFNFML